MWDGGRSLNYTEISKVKSLHRWTGHQSKIAVVWKNLGWQVLAFGASVSLMIPGAHTWSLVWCPEAGTASAAFAGAQSLLRVGVSSRSPWGSAKVEGWVELCIHWVLLGFCKKWQMQTSAGTPKCCLPREHLGLSFERKFAEELGTSGCWEQGWGWRGEDVSNTGVKNDIFYSFSEGLSGMPTSEMLPHMQGNALLLLLPTCVFSRAACTGKRHWLLPPLWWQKCCENRQTFASQWK